MTTAEYSNASQAYDRYAAVTDYKNFLGHPVPPFDELTPTQQKAWLAASTIGTTEHQEQIIVDIHINISRVQGILRQTEELLQKLLA